MSNLVYYILLGIFAFSNAAGGLMMKFGSKHVSFGHGDSLLVTMKTMITNWQLIAGICFYGFSFVISTLIYTKINLNIAYPIMVTLAFFLISIASIVFLNEKFTLIQILGSLFMVIGIVLVATNVKTA